MVRIVFLGAPGAGKGTQARELSERLGIPHLSTGELLRAAVRAKSVLGQEADGFIRAGQLVPDDLVLRILGERLAEPDTRSGFILDGYPRNRSQAESLARTTPIDLVVYFDIPEAPLIERLTQRWSCPECGSVYNVATRPPKVAGKCDLDGSALTQRSDDAPEAVRTRLAVYREQTTPLLAYYQDQKRLRSVDARGSPEEVRRRLLALVGG